MKRTVSLNSTSKAHRKPSISWGINNSNRWTSICTTIHSCLTNQVLHFSRQKATTITISRRPVSLASWITGETWTRGALAHTMPLTQEKGKKEVMMLLLLLMSIKIMTNNNLNLKWSMKSVQVCTQATQCTGEKYRVHTQATITLSLRLRDKLWLQTHRFKRTLNNSSRWC